MRVDCMYGLIFVAILSYVMLYHSYHRTTCNSSDHKKYCTSITIFLNMNVVFLKCKHISVSIVKGILKLCPAYTTTLYGTVKYLLFHFWLYSKMCSRFVWWGRLVYGILYMDIYTKYSSNSCRESFYLSHSMFVWEMCECVKISLKPFLQL